LTRNPPKKTDPSHPWLLARKRSRKSWIPFTQSVSKIKLLRRCMPLSWMKELISVQYAPCIAFWIKTKKLKNEDNK
jgi:hypothetical protein